MYEDENFNCSLCDQVYISQFALGTHFLQYHNTYGDFNRLDNKHNDCNGFFGYELLIKIGMCRFVMNNINSRSVIDINTDSCILCCSEYTDYMRSKTTDDMFCTKLDNSLLSNKYKYSIDRTKLSPVLSKQIIRYPLQLLCCKAMICSECIKHHINAQKGEPICPFCRKVHINTNKRFIIYDERPKTKIALNPHPYPIDKITQNNDSNSFYRFYYYDRFDWITESYDSASSVISSDSEAIELDLTIDNESFSESIDPDPLSNSTIESTIVSTVNDYEYTDSDDDTDSYIDYEHEMQRINMMIDNYRELEDISPEMIVWRKIFEELCNNDNS